MRPEDPSLARALGRDLTLPLEALRAQDPHPDTPLVTLPSLKAAGVALAFATLFVDPRAGAQEDWEAEVYAQLALYEAWERRGLVRVLREREDLLAHLERFPQDGVLGLVLLLDFAKGVFAVALGEFLARDYTGGLAAGAAAAFAHALSPWLGLRRAGSLLAPLGVLFAVDPRLLLLAGLPAGVLLLGSRKAHPALLAFALALPLAALLLGGGQAHLLFALALSLALLWPPR